MFFSDGLALPALIGSVSSVDPDAAALAARMTTPPSAARQQLISDTITSLKSAGIWDKLDVLWVMAAADSQAAGLNWKNSNFTLSPVNTPTFTADRGYNGDGTTSYLGTGYDPSSVSVQANINSHTFGAWVNNGAATMNVIEMGSNEISLTVNNSSQKLTARSSTSGAIVSVPSVPDGLGLSGCSRTSSTAVSLYKNGSLFDPRTASSIALTASEIYLGARNLTGTGASAFSPRRLAVAYVGLGLSDSENTALYNALNNYLTSVGGA